jgi:hypothetical protein
MNILETSAEILREAGFNCSYSSKNEGNSFAFEDQTILGFLFVYPDPIELVECWAQDAEREIASHQLGLRRAGQKAWNTCIVLLGTSAADYAQSVILGAIEEDLTGTRKIIRAGIADIADIRAALLPLLPLQQAPKLEAVDILAEIRQRTTELPKRVVEAFLSSADEAVVMQVLEELR